MCTDRMLFGLRDYCAVVDVLLCWEVTICSRGAICSHMCDDVEYRKFQLMFAGFYN